MTIGEKILQVCHRKRTIIPIHKTFIQIRMKKSNHQIEICQRILIKDSQKEILNI